MALFSKFYKREKIHNGNNHPKIEFGRYLSCNKPFPENKKFNTARHLFESEDYLGSFEKLLSFLDDPAQENIIKSVGSEIIDFTLYQGTQKLSGSIDKDDFFVSCSIGMYQELNPALFRYLLTKNHNLQYCCFAVNQNEVILKAYSKTKESSPEKLFFILKEIALTADIETEAFKNEFPFLERKYLIDKMHLADDELKVKFNYLKKWIADTLQVLKANQGKDDSIISYAILGLLYRIDFLLVPEGKVKLITQKCISMFNQKGLPVLERTEIIKAQLMEISSLSKDELLNSFCRYKYTFGIVEASSHKMVYDFILRQFDQVKMLYTSNYDNEKILCFYEYILGYILYYYGVFPATKKLMLLIYRVLYPGFFNELGISPGLYMEGDNKLDKINTENSITKIIKEERKEYPRLSLELSSLNYDSKLSFISSLLNAVTFLNFSQPEL